MTTSFDFGNLNLVMTDSVVTYSKLTQANDLLTFYLLSIFNYTYVNYKGGNKDSN